MFGMRNLGRTEFSATVKEDSYAPSADHPIAMAYLPVLVRGFRAAFLVPVQIAGCTNKKQVMGDPSLAHCKP